MFKYVYEIAPIDFMDGTMLIRNYIDSIISDLSWYRDLMLEDSIVDEKFVNNFDVNSYSNTFETSFMGGEHVFCKLNKIGKDIEDICMYFNKKKLKICKEHIRIFSVPTDGECTVSYMVKTNKNGITYIFSDLYFPFLNRKDNNLQKFD